MEDRNIPYFRNLWGKNVSDLENQCKLWEEICSDIPLPDDVHGEVRTVIGLAKLLINQKLKQFKGLIDDSEFHTGEKEITCTDLEGFWDMVNFEVEKIHKSFDRLSKCKNNNWKFIEENPEKPLKKVLVKKDITAINKKKETTKAHILAARQRIAEARKRMAENKEENGQNNIQILVPQKEECHEKSINIATLNDKTVIKESNDIKQDDYYVPKKKSTSAKRNDLGEELLNLKNAPKHNINQRKKLPISDKENVNRDNNSCDVKHISAIQAEYATPESEKLKRTKSSILKLQCVTRSAAKKALLIQQNVLSK